MDSYVDVMTSLCIVFHLVLKAANSVTSHKLYKKDKRNI